MKSSVHWRLEILGSPALRAASDIGAPPVPVQPKRFALLSLVALVHPRPCRRDFALGLLWPDSPQGAARNALSQALHGLRSILGVDAIRSEGDEALSLAADIVACDAVEFLERCRDGDIAGASRLYRGELLTGFHVSGAGEFQWWLEARRTQLQDEAIAMLKELARRAESAGDLHEATAWIRRLRTHDPDDEAHLRWHISLLDRQDRRADALREFDRFAHGLAEDDGLEPSDETRELAARVRAGEEPTAPRSEAMDAYLRGLFHRHRRTREDLMIACRNLERAVELDPEFGLAYSALAMSYALSGQFLYAAMDPRAAHRLAEVALERAHRLGENGIESLVTAGMLQQFYTWDWQRAGSAFRSALDCDPRNVYALAQLSNHLVLTGRFDQALATMRTARALDPSFILPHVFEGVWMIIDRRFGDAIARLEAALSMDTRSLPAMLYLGDAYRFRGDLDRADNTFRDLMSIYGPEPLVVARQGWLAARRGDEAAARHALDELDGMSSERVVGAMLPAEVLIGLGRIDEAMGFVDQAVEERDTHVILLGTWPGYDPLRSHARFAGVLKQIGIPSSF